MNSYRTNISKDGHKISQNCNSAPKYKISTFLFLAAQKN